MYTAEPTNFKSGVHLVHKNIMQKKGDSIRKKKISRPNWKVRFCNWQIVITTIATIKMNIKLTMVIAE